MTTTNMKPEIGNEHVTVRNGYWFYFDDHGLKITAFGSGISAKEIIFVEDEIVSSKRSIAFISKHSFSHKQDNYEVEFLMKNYWTAEVECVLSKNGQIISRATKAYYKKDDPRSMRELKMHVLVGVVTGAVITFLVLAGLKIWK